MNLALRPQQTFKQTSGPSTSKLTTNRYVAVSMRLSLTAIRPSSLDLSPVLEYIINLAMLHFKIGLLFANECFYIWGVYESLVKLGAWYISENYHGPN